MGGGQTHGNLAADWKGASDSMTDHGMKTLPQAAGTAVPLGLLGAAAFLVAVDVRMIDPLLPIIAGEFGTDVGGAALAVTAYAIPYGLCQLVYGPLGDRLGKVRVMAGALAAFALGTGACAFAPSLAVLVVLRLLTGVAAAALFPMALAYIGDTFPYATRQAAIGRLVGAIALGQIASAGLGGFFGQYASWRSLFGLCGLAALAAAALLWRAARATPCPSAAGGAQPRGVLAPYLGLLKLPATRLMMAVVFLEGGFFFGAFAYLGAFLREQYGLPYGAIGLILGGFGLGLLVASRAVRPLLATLGERALMGAGGSLVAAVYLALTSLGSWQLAVPLIVALGAGFSMLHTTLQTKATELAPAARGTAVALFAFSISLGQGVGAAAMGRLATSAGFTPLFVCAGCAVALLTLGLVLRGDRLQRPAAGTVDGSALAASGATVAD